MNTLRINHQRADQLRTFVKRDTRETVVWAAGRNRFLWHATVDRLHSICNRNIIIDVENNPYPSTHDRSNDLMTCMSCQDLVIKLPAYYTAPW